MCLVSLPSTGRRIATDPVPYMAAWRLAMTMRRERVERLAEAQVAHRKDIYEDLELVLVKCEDGYSYDWQDQHGATRCCGWFRGTESQACVEAIAHLEGGQQ